MRDVRGGGRTPTGAGGGRAAAQAAGELNRALRGSVAAALLSGLGRRLYFPRGIVGQSAEAEQLASRLNATAGMAFGGGEPLHLSAIRAQLPGLEAGEIFPYAPTGGVRALRESWLAAMRRKSSSLAGRRTSLPVVVSGITHGISLAAELFVEPGEAVLLPELHWDNYALIFGVRRRARLQHYSFYDDRGGLNVEGLARRLHALGRRRAVVVLNFPHNPTGYSPSREEAAALCALLAERARRGQRLLVLLDDAYFGLFYEPELYQESLFGPCAGLHENILAVKVDGATKEELVWGFRIGFLTLGSAGLQDRHYRALEAKILGGLRSSVSSSGRLTQSLLLRALGSPSYEEEKARVFEALRLRYRRTRELLPRLRGPLQPLPFNSGYFLTFRLEGGSAEQLRQRLLRAHGVGTVSIQDRYLRVAYSAVELEQLPELYRAIYETASALSG